MRAAVRRLKLKRGAGGEVRGREFDAAWEFTATLPAAAGAGAGLRAPGKPRGADSPPSEGMNMATALRAAHGFSTCACDHEAAGPHDHTGSRPAAPWRSANRQLLGAPVTARSLPCSGGSGRGKSLGTYVPRC